MFKEETLILKYANTIGTNTIPIFITILDSQKNYLSLIGFSTLFLSELSLLPPFWLKSEHMLTLSLSFSPENFRAVGRSRHWMRTWTNQMGSQECLLAIHQVFRNQRFSRDPWEKKLWSLSSMKNAPSPPVFSRKNCLSQRACFHEDRSKQDILF